jgi:acyl-CoA synthetase (AMP-forming)/AMP-acid ligase II
MNVRDLLKRSAEFHRNRDAVVYGERRVTFGDAWQRGLRMANGLLSMGAKPGDRVAVLEDNCLESVDFLLGTAIAGLVRVPLFARNKRKSHAEMLRSSGCRVAVVSEHYADELDGFADELDDLNTVFVRDAGYEDWLAAQSDSDPGPAIDFDDLYALRFTGGTTGEPKGIPLTHRIFINQFRDWFYGLPALGQDDAVLHAAPISHASGYWFIPAWMAGARNVMVSAFVPPDILDLLADEEISFLFLPPTAINALCHTPGAAEREWPKLKVLLSASAPIAETTATLAHETFGDVMYHAYGLSEALPVAQMGPKDWFAKFEDSNPLRACGKPLPFTEMQIWDENDQPVETGGEGEIVVRSEGQINGYWKNEEETAQKFTDGWLRTGDIGRLDNRGYLYLLDRKNDMIISGGFNIYPAELENVISGHPDVVEAAVVGVPHDKWGETPLALCTVKDGAGVAEEDIVALVADALGSYKKPGHVELTSEPLPKTPVGKIDRKAIKAVKWAALEASIGGA